jgi:UDP-glucose 4-epimerase
LPHQENHKPKPCSPYAGAKLASEAMLLSYAASFGLEVVCFRYFNVYGSRQNPHSPYSGVLSIILEGFRSHRPITVYGDGEQTRDFIAVHDVAFANAYALTAPDIVSGQYNLCTGRATSINQILEIFAKSYPKPSRIQYENPRIGDIRHSLGDATLTKEKLKIVAKVSLDEGLQTMINATPRLGLRLKPPRKERQHYSSDITK